MARIPGTSKAQDRAKRRRCPGCGRMRSLVHVTGSLFACHGCRVMLAEAWEKRER